MVYKSVTVKHIIGKLIRNTRLSDSSYAADLIDWLSEAIGKMETKYQLSEEFEFLKVKDHSALLPCGLAVLDAVIHEGHRLSPGGSQLNIKHNHLIKRNDPDAFVFQPDLYKTYEGTPHDQMETRVSGSDIKAVNVGKHSHEFYKIQLNYIQTSFECGIIELHFKKQPIDDEGYPLIPDNENYKEACYWYLLMKLIEAGYEHHLFKWDHCYQMWETLAPRARNEIQYPSIDRMESLRQSSTRLVFPTNFYNDFFNNSEQYRGTNFV